jgi:hypothetical protein
MRLMDLSGNCVCVVSEEDEDIHWCPGGENAKYILAIDPLDGSSNIDVNASIGSIFSIYRRLSPDKPVTKEDASLLKLIGEQIHHEEMSPRVKGMETIKIRIEEPDVQFYASDEKSLIGIANKLKFGDNRHFISIMTPAQKEHEKFLLDGFTLRKTKVLWPYRVLFRDGKYSSETKAQIVSYLKNLEDQVKVPRNLWEQLEKGAWIWGGYIYVHDKSLALMLGLIDGRLISKIEEFKVVEKQE